MSAHIKRGLVLAGGGALGSYQCGALLAFKEAGIRFEAVAGTSVGGLNAALWSCGRLNEGNDFWSSVNYDKVYPAKSKVLNRLPGRVRHRLLKLMLVANICTALLLGQPVPQQVARQRASARNADGGGGVERTCRWLCTVFDCL
jgi:predicted acylesterase/phospholipase RssA